MNNRLRYSLVSLGAAVALIAVALVALKNPSPSWAVGLVYLTFGIVVWATINGAYARRRFAGGFAIGSVAWLGLITAFSQPALRSPDNWPSGYKTDADGQVIGNTKGPYAIEENPFVPDQVFRWLSNYFHDRVRARSLNMLEPEYLSFRVIACCAATWLMGLLSGIVACLVRPMPDKARE